MSDNWYSNYIKRMEKDAEKASKDILVPLAKLKEQGVVNIELEYYGCGDSGEIESYHFLNSNNQEINVKDKHCLDDYIYRMLTYDWYNNDGGSGYVSIDLNKGKINIDPYYYYTEWRIPEHQKTDFNLDEIIHESV